MGDEHESLERTRVDDGEVMATVDVIDGKPHVIIADTSRDGAWIAMPDDKARPLSLWR